MNYNFLCIQILGFVAWLFMLVSYYRPNTNKILIFLIIGNILFCFHYFLLGAYSGLFICFCDMIFDYFYYKSTKDNIIYLISIPVRIFGGLLTFKGLIDTLPIVASLIEGYSLTKEKKMVVIGAVITYIIWTIYDLVIMSYSGAFFDIIIIISNIGIIYHSLSLKKS